MACSCEIFTKPILDEKFQEHGFRRNAAVSILAHFVISSFPVGLFLLHAETLRDFTFSEPCIVQYIYIYIYIYMRKTNKLHTLFPLFVSIILSSTCFEIISSSSGDYFCTSSMQYFPGTCIWCLVANTL